jgi:DNA-binding transcriptional LysR family regulator
MSGGILRHIEAILETGSIVAASRKLFVSQPSLTQYVKRVEAEYEIEIFDRSSTPWKLTQEGEKLLEAQRRIDAIERECRQYFADRKGLKTGAIRVGSTAYRTATLLNPVLSVFKRAYPGISVSVEEGTTREVIDWADAGRVDCAFAVTEMVPSSMEHEKVFAEGVLVGLAPDHPIARGASAPAQLEDLPEIDFKGLADTPFIIMKSGQIFHEYFNRLCEKYRVLPPVSLETQSILTVPALIATGLGAALIPSTIAEGCRERDVVLFRLPAGDLPVNEVSIAWRRGRYQGYAARAFIQTCLQVLGRLDCIQKNPGTMCGSGTLTLFRKAPPRRSVRQAPR